MTNTHKQEDEQARLQSHVDSIAKDISEGITYADAGQTHLADDNNIDHDELVSGFDWLSDCLDIQYVVNSDRTFRSAKVLVTFGGPNIWVCFDDMKVKGYWWGDYAESSFSGEFADSIEEALEELWNMGA